MLSEENVRIQYLGTNPSSDVPILSLIFLSFIVHNLVFQFLPSSMTPFVKSYILSCVHACISVLAVCLFYAWSSVNLTEVNRILGGCIKGTTDELMTYSVCYSAGYFVYDLLIMVRFKSVRTQSALIHHIIIVIAGLSGLYTHVAHSSHFLMLAEELSTIPLNLKTISRQQSRIHDIFAGLFVFTFVLSRLIYGSIICWYTFRLVPRFIKMASELGDTTCIVFVIAQILLFILTRILNLYWTILIVRKLSVGFRSKKWPVSINTVESSKKAL